jgi:malate dehydrogenase
MKVTIVGGNVGATCADVISYRGIASEVVLLDIKEGFAEGKRWILCNVQLIQDLYY